MGVLYEKRGHVAYITIDNAAKANILDRATSDAIAEAWKNVWDDYDVRVAILTGTGDRHFCAGHNLEPPPGISAEDRERVRSESVFWPPSGTVNGSKFGADVAWATTIPRSGNRSSALSMDGRREPAFT